MNKPSLPLHHNAGIEADYKPVSIPRTFGGFVLGCFTIAAAIVAFCLFGGN